MKRVPALEEEPPELARWRADNPEDDHSPGGNAKGAWERFKSSGAYRPLLERLLARQQGLCGYCEQRLIDPDGSWVVNDYQIEHVLAKSGGSARVLDWRNFMLCCWGGTWAHHKDPTRYSVGSGVSCGQAKGSGDIDRSCDPRSLPWRDPVVRVDVDGRLRPNDETCRAAGIDPELLGRVIEEDLCLNCERLRVARQKVIRRLDGWLEPLHEELVASSHLSASKLAQEHALFIEGRLCPDRHGHLREFWTTERLYLGEDAEAWIRENAKTLHFE